MAPQLPGFYFDEEKKKYFKIQPNHIAPSNAKYSSSNVKHEQHLAKKQKVHNDHHRALQRQTVLPARIMKHPLLASGLLQECGQSYASPLNQREHAFLRSLQPDPIDLTYPLCAVWDAHWAGESRIVVVVTPGLISMKARKEDRKFELKSSINHFSTSDSQIRSSYMSTISGEPYVLACTGGSGQNACFVPIDTSRRMVETWHVSDTLADCAMNQNAILAFAGEDTISTFNTVGQGISSVDLSSTESSNAIEWLNVHTLAYGTCKSRKKKPSEHIVMLWDVRSPTATAARFTRPKRITGISKPNSSGNNLVVTSNYDISLYDLRLVKADRPILSIPHMSAGPVTYHATHNGNMLAAIDDRQALQTYSWRTGKHVKTVSSPSQGGQSKMLRNVKWHEGEGGLELQVCRDRSVLSFVM